MSNKSRKKKSVHPRQRMDGTPVKKDKFSMKEKSLVQSNPKLTILVLIVTYFLLDYLMMNTSQTVPMVLVVIFATLAMSTLYSFYAYDYHRDLYPSGGTDVPKFVKNRKKYVITGWLIISIWGILFLIAEPFVVPKCFPVLDSTYYPSQIVLMLYIAPVMEEIIFRYLLYDRWLKRKWGWFLGFVAASLIFVLCHPVTNMHSLIIYWTPTLLFFLIYQEFGLYGSILIHMIYNMLAI